MSKSFEDFLEFRNKVLATGGKKGYHVFDNSLAKVIYDAKPTTLSALSKIKGFPKDGARYNQYGDKIINWFFSSSVF